MKQPSLGRVVHYVNENGVELAALVVKVWNEQVINLVYFPNGSEVGGVPMTKTSVSFSLEKTPHSFHWPEYVLDAE